MTPAVPVTFPPLPDLAAELAALLVQIPRGCVSSYGDLAEALGDLAAAKWVAGALSQRDRGSELPVHRVIRRTRKLVGKSPETLTRQRLLLEGEGCRFDAQGRIGAAHLWCRFETTKPLRRLAEWQTAAAGQVNCSRRIAVPPVIAGVDLSYRSPAEGVAAYVAIATATQQVVAQHVCRVPTPFPYISGYLTFRELPPLLQLLSEVRARGPLAEVILVDGSGRLHPRRFGIAAAVGLMSGCTTVGVAKHRLCGQPRREPQLPLGRAVWHDHEWLGVATDGGFGGPILYVSPGCGIDVLSAAVIVQAVWTDRRGPLPITLADRISRQTARTTPLDWEPRL